MICVTSRGIDRIVSLILFRHPIDELDPRYDIEDGQIVLLLVCVPVEHFLRHGTGLILDEIECVHHKFDCCPPVNADREHADDATRQAIVQAEG